MARARNIKPSFFDNDLLAECEPLGRLLFIGLWTLSDFNGNLEWRSKRVKKQLLAYDNCDINKLAINLDKNGFIRFYSDGESIYLNIVNFGKHQNPHKNERDKGSEIPVYSNELRQAIDLNGLTINHDLSGLKRNSSTSNPADSLIPYPDSLSLNPDTCMQGDETIPATPKKVSKRFAPPTYEEAFKYFSERGFTNKQEAEKFVDFYAMKNWYVGKNKMKDWKAAVRNWTKNSTPQKQTSLHDIKNIDYGQSGRF